jgi:hypothetical protein
MKSQTRKEDSGNFLNVITGRSKDTTGCVSSEQEPKFGLDKRGGGGMQNG